MVLYNSVVYNVLKHLIQTMPTYSRHTAFGNMKSVIVGFVFYAEVVFYMPRLSVKAS